MNMKIILTGDELSSLTEEFVNDLMYPIRVWSADQLFELKRIFPSGIISMFKTWYRKRYGLHTSCDFEKNEFFSYFENELDDIGVSWKRRENKSEYSQIRDEFKYNFSKLRLGDEGTEIYIQIKVPSKKEPHLRLTELLAIYTQRIHNRKISRTKLKKLYSSFPMKKKAPFKKILKAFIKKNKDLSIVKKTNRNGKVKVYVRGLCLTEEGKALLRE
jgi:hypothetical protein